jgi:hypothetical protein
MQVPVRPPLVDDDGAADAPARMRSRDPVWLSIVIVALAFGASQLLVMVGASVAGADPWQSRSFAHWDSAHYLAIAEHGYDLHHCDTHAADESLYTSRDWCGNAGWFPGYPIAMKAVSAVVPISTLTAGVLLSRVAHVGMLAVLWFGFLRRRSRAPAVIALLIAACFPGFVYQDALFPVSITLLAIVASLCLLARRRPLVGGVVGMIAVVSYPSAITLVAVGVLFCLLARQPAGDAPSRLKSVALYASPLVLAYLGVLLGYQIAVGKWNAWMLTQHHYGYGPSFFATAWLRHVGTLVPVGIGSTGPALQTLLVAALVLSGLAAAWRVRAQLDSQELAVAAYAIVFWLAPLSLGGALSLYRAEALLAPAAVVTTRLPRRFQLGLLIACIGVGVVMSAAFFESVLV